MKTFIFTLMLTLTAHLFATNSTLPIETEIQQMIHKMTTKEKIGQLFNIAIVGKKLKPEYEKFIKEYQIGGVTLFNYNIRSKKQVKHFVSELQGISKIPMFVSVDQEGGRITRYKKGDFLPPSLFFLGQLNDKKTVKTVAKYTAQDLLAVGINLNIAPVADILTTSKNKAIFDRSFGGNTKTVSTLTKAYMKALQSQGALAVIKHFPGQGSIEQDTHKTLPYSRIKKEKMLKRELKPFKEAIDEGLVHVLMSSHVIFTDIDHKYPATLSKKVLGDILRKELKYEGIIFTDGLEMKAVLDTYGLEQATLLALQGEVDVVTINWDLKNVKRAVAYIEKSLKEGKLTISDIDKKLARILKVKKQFLYSQKKTKRLNRKQASSFLMNMYKKGMVLQHVKPEDLKGKPVFTNIKQLRKSPYIEYQKVLLRNLKNSIIILDKKSYLAPNFYGDNKGNIVVILGPDLGLDWRFKRAKINKKDVKMIFLHDNNYFTRKLLENLIKNNQ